MKASNEFIERLKADFLKWYNQFDDKDKQVLKNHYRAHNAERLRWDIYWQLNALNGGYKEFTKGLKDNHINTALKRSISIPFIMTGESMMY